MQTLPINYLHYTSKFCGGYEKYLLQKRVGIIGVFNWGFFFFNFFWLSYHKMYKELSLSLYFYCMVLIYTANKFISLETASSLILTFYALGCYYSYYFYENSFNSKVKLDKPESYTKMKPFNGILSVIIFCIFVVLNVITFSKFLTIFIH